MMEPTPASMAVMYPCMWMRRKVASSTRVSPWSIGAPVPQVVPPSPMKCLAQASTEKGFRRSSPWKPRTAAAAMGFTTSGDSPKPSYVRPQRSSCGAVTHGAKTQLIPLARTSSAVTHSARSPSRVARAAQTKVVREDHRTQDVVVAVDGVHAVEQRNRQAGFQGARLVTEVHGGPIGRAQNYRATSHACNIA